MLCKVFGGYPDFADEEIEGAIYFGTQVGITPNGDTRNGGFRNQYSRSGFVSSLFKLWIKQSGYLLSLERDPETRSLAYAAPLAAF